MRHDDYRELLALQAFGAVDPADRPGLEAHLSGCASCSAELDQLRDTSADLARLAPPIAPRADHFERLLERLDARRAPDAGHADARPVSAGRSTRRPRAWWPRIVAATCAAAAAVLLVSHWHLVRRLEAAYGEIERMRAIGRFVASPDVSVVPLWGSGAQYAKLGYDRSTGRFMLISPDLPPLPQSERYQLWVLSERIHPAAAFRAEAPGGRLVPPGRGVFLFAVSVETLLDVDEPTGALILLSGPIRDPHPVRPLIPATGN